MLYLFGLRSRCSRIYRNEVRLILASGSCSASLRFSNSFERFSFMSYIYFFSLILFFYLGSSCFFPRLPSYFFFPIICYIVFSLRFLFSHALFPITDFQREREREKSEKRRLKQPKMYVLYVQKKRHVIENVSHYIFLPIVFFGIDS